jgi:hypothetical protein
MNSKAFELFLADMLAEKARNESLLDTITPSSSHLVIEYRFGLSKCWDPTKQ